MYIRQSTCGAMLTSTVSPSARNSLETGGLYVQKLPSGRSAFVRKPANFRSAGPLVTRTLLSPTLVPQRAEADIPYPIIDMMPAPGVDYRLAQRPQSEVVSPLAPLASQAAMSPDVLPPAANTNHHVFANSSAEAMHRCSVCGRYRSPSYHHRHPIIPGRTPSIGVCHKCRDSETSSNESTDSNTRRKRQRNKKKIRGNKDGYVFVKRESVRYQNGEESDHEKACPSFPNAHRRMESTHNAHSCYNPRNACDHHRYCHDHGSPPRERHIYHTVYAERPPQAVNCGNTHFYTYPPPPGAMTYGPAVFDGNPIQSYSLQNR
ncbi:hypothetical protein PRK78_004006 [Emydomyces testavorans]|uniref:Uncharacterized protein n=1 Tax=Emydomyces testavorans TaxID=2070801 RepID=A0AAF0DHY0_9EURO|nr:hypothetical protein PRK78_004006 [Emydomyces testavorans]